MLLRGSFAKMIDKSQADIDMAIAAIGYKVNSLIPFKSFPITLSNFLELDIFYPYIQILLVSNFLKIYFEIAMISNYLNKLYR